MISPRLTVSSNGRYLVTSDGRPFFYLADTAWELAYRLDREEVEHYLRNRADKQFNVIQMVALDEYGFDLPNRYGDTALHNNDPLSPNERYFDYLDWIVSLANSLGLTVALLPTWGDKWNKAWGKGPEIFTQSNAYAYGKWIGARFRHHDLIWVLGGDRNIDEPEHVLLMRAMAAGLTEGDGGTHLRTYHPSGGHSSADWLHDESWLDFNMRQTGHHRDYDSYSRLSSDYSRQPVKPCLDGEPGYEDIPASFKPELGYLDECEVRRYAYSAVFAGACGHTYGCHAIWQFYDPTRSEPIQGARTPWLTALDFPGANQMRYLRSLIESRPYLTRIPDQSVLESVSDTGLVYATRDLNRRYIMVYTSEGHPFGLHLPESWNTGAKAYWCDPRTGGVQSFHAHAAQRARPFVPPSSGHGQDWVLVIDDAASGYPAPGSDASAS